MILPKIVVACIGLGFVAAFPVLAGYEPDAQPPGRKKPAQSKKQTRASTTARTAQGRYVKVVCDFDDPNVRDAALKIAEAAWAETTRMFGLSNREDASHGGSDGVEMNQPARLYLYATVAAYEKAESKLTKGAFKANLAFTTRTNPSAHVVVQPPMSGAVRKRVGLTEMTRRLIAHETGHLCRNTRLPNRSNHPRWLADGVAWLVEQAVITGKRNRRAHDSPYVDELVLTAQRLMREGKFPAIRRLMTDDFGGASGFDVYAVTQLIFEFLATRDDGTWVKKTLAAARSIGGGNDYVMRLRAAALDAITSASDVDSEFRAYLASRTARWNQVYRSLDVDGKKWTQVAFPEKNAIAWRTRAPQGPFEISGAIEFLPGGRPQMNVLIGRAIDGFHSVAMVQGVGLRIFRFHAKTNEWERLADASPAGLLKRNGCRFRVSVREDELEVFIDDAAACRVPLSSPIHDRPWGVGAQAGSAGIWRDVRVKRLASRP